MFKRNQVEEAISRAFGEASSKPSSELRTRIKRLLDLDRSLGRSVRSENPENSNYAFYREDSPGKGVEIQFSEYEAFALSLGLRLLRHGWPQSFAVATLRRLRPQLEQQHSRFMKQGREKLFDKDKIREAAVVGNVAYDNTDPVILTIVSGQGAGDPSAAVCRGMKDVSKFMQEHNAQSSSFHELVTPAYHLTDHLNQSRPRNRGRSA